MLAELGEVIGDRTIAERCRKSVRRWNIWRMSRTFGVHYTLVNFQYGPLEAKLVIWKGGMEQRSAQ
jgi:hypothetical protein